MRRDNYKAKQELKGIYNYKLEKLKTEMLEQKQQGEDAIKKQLKFQQRVAQVHRQRAENYKSAAD